MSAGYLDARVLAEADACAVEVRFVLENRSGDTWEKGGGVCLGWQVYDAETSRFIAEGDWKPLAGALPPGGRLACELRAALPPDDGRYHIYVSPRSEEFGWFHQQHWPFLLVEAEVREGRVQEARADATTIARLRRGSIQHILRTLLVEPPRILWTNRGLMTSMVRRDITARYRGSFGDVLWTVLHPLLLMLTYFFVFGIVLQARFGNDPSRAGFVLYFLAGMLPWLPLSDAAARAPAVILENRNFVKKLVFPVEILPANLVLSGLVTQFFALLVFLAFLLWARGGVPATIAWFPLLLGPQLLLAFGLCWLLAALGAFLRDLGQIIGFLLTLWFFLTPICYPEASLPGGALAVLRLNPLFALVRAWRDILLEAKAPDFAALAGVTLAAVVVWLAGYGLFRRLRYSFPDVL